MSLDDVQDIELLRRAAKLLEHENQKMARTIAKLKRQIQELEGKVPKQLELQLAELEEQLARRNKLLFGKRSEQRKPSADGAAEGSASEEPKKQTGHGRREQLKLPVEEQVHTLNAEASKCDLCGGELKAWNGQFEESEEVDVIERRFVIRKHKRQKYKCSCGSCIETAPGPVKLTEGGRYSPAFAAHVAVSKYGDHMPLERQVRTMARDGLVIDSQTLWDQINLLAWYLKPAYERLGQEVMRAPVIGVDETHWRLMGEKGKPSSNKRWQVWAAVSEQAVFYQLEPSRSADAAEKLIGNYTGVVLCDDYIVYRSLKKRGAGFQIANCWAHVRRKFVEVNDLEPGRADGILDLIGELYQVERDIRGKPPDEVLRERKARSKPILIAIQNWTFEQEALPQSALRKAIQYMGGVWDGLHTFLDHAEVDLDNNRTERALRGIVVGRKNHYGSRSVRGTEVAAQLYSLIESAKLVGVEPLEYLNKAIHAALRGERIPLPSELA